MSMIKLKVSEGGSVWIDPKRVSAVQEVAGEGDACLVVVTDKSHKVMHSAAEVVAMLRPFGGDLNLVER